MWARGLLKRIRWGLAAAMIAGLPLLHIGPAVAAIDTAYIPPPKANAVVAAEPVILPRPEDSWLGLYKCSSGRAIPAYSPEEQSVAVEDTPLKAPIPIIPAELAYRSDGIKRAYLTFDDGPTPGITTDILATLDRYGIKATFFVVGRMVDRHPELLQQIRAGGHTIANHSYSHRYGAIYAGVTAFSRDMDRADALLRQELGADYDLRLYRFPGGLKGWPMSMKRFVEACTEKGYCHVEWNALNGDAEHGGYKSVEELFVRLQESCAGKEDVIVLMHDSPGKETTAESLPQAIEYLQGEGYQFCLLQ